MEVIRKQTTVKNGSISLGGLEELNDRTVEVTVSPVDKRALSSQEQKSNLLKFTGLVETNHIDTSLNIDRLIYVK